MPVHFASTTCAQIKACRRTPVRALPISRYLEMPRETVRRHMGRLVALGLLERAEDQTFVPTEELRKVEIERALRLLRQGTAVLL